MPHKYHNKTCRQTADAYSFKHFNYLMQIDVPVRFVVISLFPHFSLRKREQLAKDNMLYCQLGALSVKSQIDLVCFDS